MRTDTARQSLHFTLVAMGAMIVVILLGILWSVASNNPAPFAITAIRDTWTLLANLAGTALSVIM